MRLKNPLVVSLDDEKFKNPKHNLNWFIENLSPIVGGFKLGSSLFDLLGTHIGGYGIEMIHVPVMLDEKWAQPVQTMRKIGVRLARHIHVSFSTVHARFGILPMAALQRAYDSEMDKVRTESGSTWHPMKILGVTVMTTETYEDLVRAGHARSISEFQGRQILYPDADGKLTRRNYRDPKEFKEEWVQHLVLTWATDAKTAGLAGVVCPARFAKVVREKFGPDFIIASPDIRPAGSSVESHVAPLTPTEAIKNGVDIPIMGSAITGADHPVAIAKLSVEEIQNAQPTS